MVDGSIGTLNDIKLQNSFQNLENIKINGHLVARVWFSPARGLARPVGMADTYHGKASSHQEYILDLMVQMANDEGFDAVAFEVMAQSVNGYALEKPKGMSIESLEYAVSHAVMSHLTKKKLFRANYRIGGFHSMGAGMGLRLLAKKTNVLNSLAQDSLKSDMPHSMPLYKRHDTVVGFNPYFVTAEELLAFKERCYKSDPSGRLWTGFCEKVRTPKTKHIINGIEYNFPIMPGNLCLKMPDGFVEPIFDGTQIVNVQALADQASGYFTDEHLYFFLGTEDLYNNQSLNKRLWQALNVKNKHLRIIDGANHFFDNAKVLTENELSKIMWRTGQRARKRTGR